MSSLPSSRTKAAALLILASLAGLPTAFPSERAVDPTFLHRYVPDAPAAAVDFTTPTCRYQPIFGLKDSQPSIVKGVARFGQLTIDAKGKSEAIACPREEQVLVVVAGEGRIVYQKTEYPLATHDFLYLPPGEEWQVTNPHQQPCRLLVIGYKVPGDVRVEASPTLLKANIDEVAKQTVKGHPPTVLYQLLMGDTKSTRDKIAAAHVLTSLFIMDFAPGGTNFPHHHETEEEIYLVLEGRGDMVAGGGTTGIEGRHPARAGDAYFFRLNCTVGFYATEEPNVKTRILAARSLFPFRRP